MNKHDDLFNKLKSLSAVILYGLAVLLMIVILVKAIISAIK
jgi:hypothetical protein